MLLLTSSSDQINLGINPALAMNIHTSFMDSNGTVITPGRQNTITSIQTNINIVASPIGGVDRNVKGIHIRNMDGSNSTTITVYHTDGTNNVQLFQTVLFTGEELAYVDGQGFRTFDANGALK